MDLLVLARRKVKEIEVVVIYPVFNWGVCAESSDLNGIHEYLFSQIIATESLFHDDGGFQTSGLNSFPIFSSKQPSFYADFTS